MVPEGGRAVPGRVIVKILSRVGAIESEPSLAVAPARSPDAMSARRS